MSSWRPGDRRSPSPPYRSNRYSPSRAVSPLSPRPEQRQLVNSNYGRPVRSEHYSPPRTHATLPPRPRPRSRSPSPRYRDSRYTEREKSYSPPPRQRRSPPPVSGPSSKRNRPGAADFYDADDHAHARDPPRDERRSMVADREEMRSIPPPRHQKVEAQWERGREIEDTRSSGYGYDQGREHRYGGEEEERYRDGGRDQDAPRRGKAPSQAYRDVIFLGLDEELSEHDFSSFLTSEHGARIESVKIVRDRVTGKSKNFGFAQFISVQDAEDFVLPNFPFIQMPALYAHSDPQKVKIDFSAPAPSHSSDTTRPLDVAPARRHDGTRDIGTPGGGQRVLLFRMLDWNTRGEEIIWRTSEEIARMLKKQGKEMEAEDCIVRVATIQDKAGRGASWGFAFVELVTSELAAALLSFLLSPQSQPHGFLIANRPIATSFANPAAFAPVAGGPLGGQFLLRATRNGGIGSETANKSDGTWCAYAHEDAGATEILPQRGQAIPETGILPDLSTQLRSFLGIYAGKVPGQAEEGTSAANTVPTGGLINISNVMQPIKIGTSLNIGGTSRGKKADESMIGQGQGSRKNLFGDEDEVDPGQDSVLLSRTKGAHIVPPTSGSRKIAKNISKWNNKQSELAAPESKSSGMPKGISSANAVLGSGQGSVKPQATSMTTSSGGGFKSIGQSNRPTASSSTTTAGTATSSSSSMPLDDFDYSDAQASGKVACLLCQRALPSAEVMRKHVLSSDLHKTNLGNPITVEAGQKRKQAALAKSANSDSASGATTPVPTSASTDELAPMSKYRDRAAERREVFNQPEKPSYMDRVSLSIPTHPPKRKFAEGPKEPSPPPEPGLAPGQDEANKGNALLAKMGWAAGTGLGKGKEGRVEPIEVKQLQERAGLGAGKR